ncbi:iron transporter [Candidatus Roizmanbacteria bacterium RIFCSPLOWO2_02_FULL_38_10]|uniref:Iron transporter n=1 Tax=Candidatus Roizmanbacteria bacterium RIFCSPLOWO2_02_FULL_38_10 TaxID=1802074 RepID=A0A1F7JK01_9BACT|nr:MAG: iron transporter [Candidatus Roizmanbacteria bacterium RIFCSPLOWO2_02_FULL_38_10]
MTKQKPLKEAKSFWRTLGPGLTTGASDDDPSGIATYSQTGAQFGFQLLWLAAFSYPFSAAIQDMCARLGMVTGRGLAANIRRHYPKWVLYTCTILLFTANTINVGADLGAMAKATQLIVPQASFAFLIIGFSVLILVLQIYMSYEKYAKYLKYLALFLVAYVLSGLSLNLDWRALITMSFLPTSISTKAQIMMVCAALGTTISPYLFFWQTSQEVEEETLKGRLTHKLRSGASWRDIKRMRVDVWAGIFFSNIVMYFIIVTCAATLFSAGITDITSAEQAATALKPLVGNNAYLLFTIGIIGTGLLAVPILAGSAAYALSESLGWKFGLYRKLRRATAFYGAIIISVIIGLLMNFIGLDPIKTLIYTAVLNGLIAPIILVLIVRMSSNEKIMGRHVNHPLLKILGWCITILMSVVGVATILTMF